ncbi:MAG: glycerol-3-phosphate 1-O-acyltransferase PlsY [Planctomycetes bacterium]|nr:glycerol-3-phosphate 1-O-acyltransferase PlsY [Planctomycetota bacterium]
MQNYIIDVTLIALFSYIVGSIPFGFLLAKMRGIDIRNSGSGNIGATNIGRVLGFKWFLTILLLDAGKGFVSVFLVQKLFVGNGIYSVCAALGSILGHTYTIFLGFRGGKGVATGFGTLIAMDYITALFSVGVWLVSMVATRIVSLSSCISATTLPLFFAGYYSYLGSDLNLPVFVFLVFIVVFVIFKHRANFARIIDGTEPKVNLKR